MKSTLRNLIKNKINMDIRILASEKKDIDGATKINSLCNDVF